MEITQSIGRPTITILYTYLQLLLVHRNGKTEFPKSTPSHIPGLRLIQRILQEKGPLLNIFARNMNLITYLFRFVSQHQQIFRTIAKRIRQELGRSKRDRQRVTNVDVNRILTRIAIYQETKDHRWLNNIETLGEIFQANEHTRKAAMHYENLGGSNLVAIFEEEIGGSGFALGTALCYNCLTLSEQIICCEKPILHRPFCGCPLEEFCEFCSSNGFTAKQFQYSLTSDTTMPAELNRNRIRMEDIWCTTITTTTLFLAQERFMCQDCMYIFYEGIEHIKLRKTKMCQLLEPGHYAMRRIYNPICEICMKTVLHSKETCMKCEVAVYGNKGDFATYGFVPSKISGPRHKVNKIWNLDAPWWEDIWNIPF